MSEQQSPAKRPVSSADETPAGTEDGHSGSDPAPSATKPAGQATSALSAKEIGGQKGPEPTRYGDWEKNGRCTDF